MTEAMLTFVASPLAAGGHLINVTGEIDLATAPLLLAHVSQYDGPVTLDFSGVEYLDSAGIAALVRLYRHFDRQRSDFKLQHVHAIPLRVLEVSGLTEMLGL